MSTEKFRLRFTFWLDMSKTDEFALAEKIDELKAKRSFVKVVRDGIRLICDLRAGKTDVLLELFPWVAERFQPQQQDTSELAALVEQFKEAMVNTRSVVVTQAPTWDMPLDNKPEVRVVENTEERKKLSVKNTLAALEDF